MRLSVPPSALVRRKRYSSPTPAAGTSAYQYPFDSEAMRSASGFHWLNPPITATAVACGAQTRNATPFSWGTAPIPARAVDTGLSTV